MLYCSIRHKNVTDMPYTLNALMSSFHLYILTIFIKQLKS
ncbi:hypothetical protein Leryth_026594 [Lithospermum erythrorhizon]|nr:hypothetical protein Leryth_026594 [Lithospermum erythrorhizon]